MTIPKIAPDVEQALERAMRERGKIHAFLSGGGLRVVRAERDGELLAYGEHPHMVDALRHAAEDFDAGGRPYREVYGVTEPRYLTGDSTPADDLDAWVRRGATFDARYEANVFCFELRALAGAVRRGRGSSFSVAMASAFEAKHEEETAS